MAKEVIILGVGAAGRYVHYLLSYNPEVRVVGFTNRDPATWGQEFCGKPILGGDEILPEFYARGVRYAIIGIGSPDLRRRLHREVVGLGFELMSAVHPSCIISPAVKIGKGVVIEAGAVLSDNPVIGDNVWLGIAPWVSHDTFIGEDSAIGGGGQIGAEVTIGQAVMVGMGAVVQSRRSIGEFAIVGSGANVVQDVPARAVVVGNPAKVIKYRELESCPI